MNDLILYAVWSKDRHRYWVDVIKAANETLPHNARYLCHIDREDAHIMITWATEKFKQGWKFKQVKRACAEL